MKCFVIAEAGVNHNGSLQRALRLVDAAAEAGADAVKFQTFKAEQLASPNAQTAEYQKSRTGNDDQLSMLRALELSDEAHAEIAARCRTANIEFMSTPFGMESVDLLLRAGVQRIKMASGELTNDALMARVAATGLPLIISTGMASLEEVATALEIVRRERPSTPQGDSSSSVTLLHCTSSYPTRAEDVNLRAMQTLREAFSLPVGFSDHTEGTAAAIAAVAMGASVVEKHFTLDRGLPGPDHMASLEVAEFARLVADIRFVEAAMGDGKKEPRLSEISVRDRVRRSVTLTRALAAGELVTASDLAILRPGTGIAPADLERVIGKRAAMDLPAWTTLDWAHLSS